MPSISLLEQSFARSRENDLAAFKAAQLHAGGGSDPFATTGDAGDSLYGCFEYMPRSLVPAALKSIAARVPHGTIEISLRRPTVDQRQAGCPDALCSDDPVFWCNQAVAAGIPVIRYVVGVQAKHLAIVW